MDMPQPRCSSQIFLGFLIIGGFFGALWWVLAHDIPDKNHDAVVYLLGVLNGAILAVIGYFFGSSSGAAAAQQAAVNKAGAGAPSPQSPASVVVNNSPAAPAGDSGVNMPTTAPQTVNVSVSPASQTPAAALSYNGQSVTKRDDGTYSAADGTILKLDEKGNLVPVTQSATG